MKKQIALIILVMGLSVGSLLAAEENKHTYKPEKGYVSEATTAIEIAEAVLIPIYGEDKINKEKPLIAELAGDVWIVKGTFHCPEGQTCLGGVAVIEISKDNGAILRVSHGK